MTTSSVSTNIPAGKPPRPTIAGTRYHRIRKIVQSICVVVFVILPLFNVMRLDLVRQRFYFFGVELWVSEFSILFFTMMFLWILVAAWAMIYGRFYCGYLCPQMIFSEAANDLERWIGRRVKRGLAKSSQWVQSILTHLLFYAVLLPPSVFFTFVCVAYFVPPADLFQRLLHFDLVTAAGIIGASVTLVTFLDFAFLRQRFCTAICPYGYLQNMLADKNTLLVHFHDPNKSCIHCERCVRECPMGIDIRQGGHQIECTHCAECVDACSAVLGKLNRPTLIRYAWGDTEEKATKPESWFRRIGFRDGKRIAILVLLAVYATGLSILIAMRQPVLVQIMPKRDSLYTLAPDGRVLNHFRVLASNRSHQQAQLKISVTGLQGAALAGLDGAQTLEPGQTLQREFDIAAPASALTPGINPMHIEADVTPGQKPLHFDENFFAPFPATQRQPGGSKP
jgi:cytochrome c oxidase accessory protein FixG